MFLALRVDRLSARLRELGAVVDRYERGDPGFADAALAWLRGAEEALGGRGMPEAAELAAQRAAIVRATERAALGDPERGRNVRRSRAVAAAEALERASATLQPLVAEAEGRLRHFEQKLVEAITAGALVGLVEGPGARPREAWVRATWGRLAEHPATRPTALYLAAALRAPDRLVVLGRILDRLAAPELPVLADARAPDLSPGTGPKDPVPEDT
ncbi:MAG: hypothetical protein R3B09_28030 [Nannocystaceae bacterium]